MCARDGSQNSCFTWNIEALTWQWNCCHQKKTNNFNCRLCHVKNMCHTKTTHNVISSIVNEIRRAVHSFVVSFSNAVRFVFCFEMQLTNELHCKCSPDGNGRIMCICVLSSSCWVLEAIFFCNRIKTNMRTWRHITIRVTVLHRMGNR